MTMCKVSLSLSVSEVKQTEWRPVAFFFLVVVVFDTTKKNVYRTRKKEIVIITNIQAWTHLK